MYISINALQKINISWWILKGVYGLTFILIGFDKIFNFIAHWQQYISPAVVSLFHVSPKILAIGAGVIEIALGITLLSPKYTKLGAYFSIGWLLLIIANYLSMHQFYDLAIKDIVLICGLFALAQLTTVRQKISTEQVV